MQFTERAYQARVEEVAEVGGVHTSIALIRAMQTERGTEACFLTDKRLVCQDRNCEWRKTCCRLVAVWWR